MKPRSLLVLTLLVGGLAAFWWFYERELPGSDERAAQAKKVLPLEEADVTALAIEWEGQTVRLEKEQQASAPKSGEDEEADAAAPSADSAKWRLTAPLAAPADDSAVNGLVSSLLNLQKDRTLQSFDRAALGLAIPRARLTVTTAAGERVLEIGGEIPASANMVVAFAGASEAHVVGKYFYSQLTKAPGDWRGKEVFRGQRDAIERVRLAAAGEAPVLLAKRGEEHWLEAPITDRADRELVAGLLTTLTTLRVERFVDEPNPDLAALGLAPAAGEIEVVLAGEPQPFRLEVGTPRLDLADPVASKRYARATSAAGTLLFETTADLTGPLARPLEEWQSRAWASLEVYQVDALEATDASGSVVVARDGADWRRGGEKGEKITYTPVSDFLYAVSGVRAESLESQPAGALGTPTLTLKLTGSEERSETLTVHPAQGDRVPVRSEGRETTLWVSAAVINDLRDKLQLVRTAAVVPGEPGEEESGDDDGGADEALPKPAASNPAAELGAGN
jgi:hypothetical protein